MRTVSLRLEDLQKVCIPIGFVGENEHTQVLIDSKRIFDEYPSAAASLAVKNPKGNTYPAVVVRDGNIVVWNVSNSDLAYEGLGELQLSFAVNNVVAKSYVGMVRVLRSLLSDGEIPDPIEDWITRANEVIGQIPNEINEALQEAKDSGEFDGYSPVATVTKQGNVATITVTDKDGTTISTIRDGVDGYSPVAQVTKVGKEATITISDQRGTTTATVSDGKDADPTELIDDTAGTGDTDKVWSANKLVSELATKYEKPSSGIPASDIASGVIPDVSGFYTKPAGGIPSTDLTSGIQTSLGKADSAYQKPQTGIPASDIAEGVIPDPADLIDDTAGVGDTDVTFSADKLATDHSAVLSALNQKYEKPQTGIPASDLASGVIPDVSGFYTKPATGIPKTDLASDVQTSLGKADTALQGQDVTEAVDDYLEENFSNPSNPPLDRTLSSALSAAPADLVGGIQNEINSLPELKESDTEDVDLDVSDSNGNVILRLADGHIKTKNFDSSNIDVDSDAGIEAKNSNATDVTLDIADQSGRVVARFANGGIETKNFNSGTVNGKISNLEEAVFPESKTTVTVSTVADLLDEIENGTSDIIVIANGTYNVLNIEVNRNVEIVGQSRTRVILNSDGTTDTDPNRVVTDRHGIRFNKGGALKNLTFNVNDVKYIFHQDNIADAYDLIIENCTFNRYDDSCGYYFFIGCGCRGKQNITVKDCSFIFSNNTHDIDTSAVYWHNWHLAKGALCAYTAELTIENCGCVGCEIVYAQDISDKTANDIVSVLNCTSTETAPVTSGANGHYIDVTNENVPYNIVFVINSKIGNMTLIDRSSSNYVYLQSAVDNFV